MRYLAEFAKTHALPVRLRTGVRRVTRAWDGWNVQLEPTKDEGSAGGAGGGGQRQGGRRAGGGGGGRGERAELVEHPRLQL